MEPGARGRLAPDSQRAYVVFDGETGTIVHVHQTLTFLGAELPPDDQGAQMAVDAARRLGHDAEHRDLRALAVAPEDLESTTRQRVDVKELRLAPDRREEAT